MAPRARAVPDHDQVEALRARAGRVRVHDLPHVGDEAPLVARAQGVAEHESLGHPQDAELLGYRPFHLRPRPHDQLHAAAPDVQHRRAPALEVHAVERGQVDEPGLLLSRHDLRVEADLAGHPLQEVLAVGRLAHGGGGDHQQLVDPVHVREPLVLAQGVEPAPHGGGGKPAARERPLAEPHHLLLAVDDVEPARAALHDDHVNGVAAEVDGRDPHLRSHCKPRRHDPPATRA